MYTSQPSGSQLIGEECISDKECIAGGFCENNKCQCSSGHIAIDLFCWRIMEPGETGCVYNEQCSSIWPNAECVRGTCRCPSEMLATQVREIVVCHYIGQCPTNGENTLLYIHNTDTLATCKSWDNSTKDGVDEVYDCDGVGEMYDCLAGVCCPSRAFTCIQPLDIGDISVANEAEQRWYFDSVNSVCKTFNYTGRGGNSNNFLTQQQCQWYCTNRCARGYPEEHQNADVNKLKPMEKEILCSADDNNCYNRESRCSKTGASDVCCPSSKKICKKSAAIGNKSTNFHYSLGTRRLGQKSSLRWYWDPDEQTCKTFMYLGQGGNFNNFLTEDQCLRFCADGECPFGSALRFEDKSLAKCVENDQCIENYYCHFSRCCPTAAYVCKQPLQEGIHCRMTAPTTRYWFNSSSRQCESFLYNGCKGNLNNFISAEHCERSCMTVENSAVQCPIGAPLRNVVGTYWQCNMRNGVQFQSTSDDFDGQCPPEYYCHYDGQNYGCCPTKLFICQLQYDSGSSCDKSRSTRWYYNHIEKLCKPFMYYGCDGNPNNFETQVACENFCQISECPAKGSPLRDSSGVKLRCGSGIDFKCPENYRCVSSAISSEEDESYCCPTKEAICALPTDKGKNCSDIKARYGFHAEQGACLAFEYGGCSGNANNFLNKESCNQMCYSSACAPMELVYISKDSQTVFECETSPCPEGYLCVKSKTSQKSVCCGTPKTGICPRQMFPYVDYYDGSFRLCDPLMKASCPEPFSCFYNADRLLHYCCAERQSKNTCPEGAQPSRNSFTGELIGCNSDEQCGSLDKCYGHDEFKSGICCTRKHAACPATFELDEKRTNVGECNPLITTSCSSNHQSICLYSPVLLRFVCCRRESRSPTTLVRCPSGTVQDPKHRFCSLDVACPAPYLCVRPNSDHVGICCKPSTSIAPRPLTKLGCRKGSKPLYDISTGDIMTCSDRRLCPSPYKCQPNSATSGSVVNVCCMETTVRCHSGAVPYSKNGVILSCSSKECPYGYFCEQLICCPEKETACTRHYSKGIKCRGHLASGRWFFDYLNSKCVHFHYNGCNPSANNFIDRNSCEKYCSEYVKQNEYLCPPPYENPRHERQTCSPFGTDCKNDEQCVLTLSRHYLCCSLPRVNSLQSLIAQMCGVGMKPVMVPNTDDPQRCHPRNNPCADGQICKFSAVLLIEICCYADFTEASASSSRIDTVVDTASIQTATDDKICTTDEQCDPKRHCLHGNCRCRKGTSLFRNNCYRKCPPSYLSVDQVCVSHTPDEFRQYMIAYGGY